jgi:acetate kinase
MKILVINAGSSSLKYQLIETTSDEVLAKGVAEKIGESDATFSHFSRDLQKIEKKFLPNHAEALTQVFDALRDSGFDLKEIAAVGHRVVHGGDIYKAPTLIDQSVLVGIESLTALAPLHNPANLSGIKAAQSLLPGIPQVAVFDTAFHSTIPPAAYTYAISHEVAEKYGVRRYGFHGTSHQYVMRKTAEFLNQFIEETNIIICHIGNGGSISAIKNGKSVDTSMGLTPLEGLMMGTRSGDIDAGVIFHLARVANYSMDDLDNLLNRDSGLLGLTGKSDMRDVWKLVKAGDLEAKLAVEVYNYRIQKYVASYFGVVPNVQAVVFTAGVGENDPGVRAGSMEPLSHLGIEIDSVKNMAASRLDRDISVEGSTVKVLVIGTNEELEIAHQSASIVQKI